jgi:hypothetical protein
MLGLLLHGEVRVRIGVGGEIQGPLSGGFWRLAVARRTFCLPQYNKHTRHPFGKSCIFKGVPNDDGMVYRMTAHRTRENPKKSFSFGQASLAWPGLFLSGIIGAGLTWVKERRTGGLGSPVAQSLVTLL